MEIRRVNEHGPRVWGTHEPLTTTHSTEAAALAEMVRPPVIQA